MNNEDKIQEAHDMADATAGGWRDGQRAAAEAAQSAPAGEREEEAFEDQAKPLGFDLTVPRNGDYRDPETLTAWRWFQAGASWQRTQAAEVAAAQAKPTGVPEGWQIAPTKDGDGFIVSSPRINGVASHIAVFSNDKDPAHKLLWHMLAAPAQPAAIEVIGYASPGQVEILRSLPRTGGMKVKGCKDGRYTEPVVLLSAARAALFAAVIRC